MSEAKLQRKHRGRDHNMRSALVTRSRRVRALTSGANGPPAVAQTRACRIEGVRYAQKSKAVKHYRLCEAALRVPGSGHTPDTMCMASTRSVSKEAKAARSAAVSRDQNAVSEKDFIVHCAAQRRHRLQHQTSCLRSGLRL